jgi:nucleotide-binding universal stress UspA family protein
MFQHILVPLDLTERHQPAVQAAVNLAKQNHGEVTLLHVIESIHGLPEDELRSFYNRIEKTASAHLERIGKQLTDQRVPWDSKLVIGSRVKEVVNFAAEHKSDLIVLTAPQVDPMQPGSGWASLSWKFAMLAHCPVLLVK